MNVAALLIPLLLLGSIACGSGSNRSEEEKLAKSAGFEVYLPSSVPSPLINNLTSTVTNGGDFGRSVELIYRSEANDAILRITEYRSGPITPLGSSETTTVRGVRVFLTQNDEFEWWAYLHHRSIDIHLEYRNSEGSVKEGLLEIVDSLLSD